jgi:hypothetical protein
MVTTTQNRNNWLNLASLLLVFPAAYVIIISILKYGLNIDGPFNVSAPMLESWGIKEPLGLNINLLILLGPVAAIILSAIQVLHINWRMTSEQFQFHLIVSRKWLPIAIGLFGCLVLACLFIYMLGENCNC